MQSNLKTFYQNFIRISSSSLEIFLQCMTGNDDKIFETVLVFIFYFFIFINVLFLLINFKRSSPHFIIFLSLIWIYYFTRLQETNKHGWQEKRRTGSTGEKGWKESQKRRQRTRIGTREQILNQMNTKCSCKNNSIFFMSLNWLIKTSGTSKFPKLHCHKLLCAKHVQCCRVMSCLKGLDFCGN